MGKQSDIQIRVELDDDKIPEKIYWKATDSTSDEPQESKAMMLAMWDPNYRETMRIDLWTKEMQLEEMNVFFFQTLMTMADTYIKANNDKKLAGSIRDFAIQFGEKTSVIKRKEEQ
jgi:gliding motility-associated protein GldC